ncbi:MAG TPA: hypothetical protein VJ846_10155 [Sphingomicrobium sp.]|nr:hypothetical protein [Sphingomicrobium sp.]
MTETRRVLIVEDSGYLSGAVGRELSADFGYQVTVARDPIEMKQMLENERFDLALVDLLYRHLSDDFEHRRRSGQVSLTGRQFLVTGLTALRALREQSPSTSVAIWTSGEGSRALHIAFAHDFLNVRVLASKDGPTGKVDTLHDIVQLALDGGTFIDETLASYLPAPGSPTLHDTFLANETNRAIWRTCALGISAQKEIAKKIGGSEKQIGKHIRVMYDKLLAFTGLPPRARTALHEVTRYAEANWEFFLDAAVRAMYS